MGAVGKPRALLLHKAQGEFINSRAYISSLLGGRGVGKTFSGAAKVLVQAKDKEPWMSVSPDSGVISDTTYPTFLDVARKYKKLVRAVKSPYPRVWFKTQDGGVADIIMRSGEKPNKLRGPNKAGLWIDEASVMSEEVFDIAIATLRIVGASNQVFMTMTPNGRHHWTFKKFYEELDYLDLAKADKKRVIQLAGSYYIQKPDTHLVRGTSYDNPFLPEGYAERLIGQYSDAFAQQEVYGNFVDLAGLLFNRQDFNSISASQVPRDGARVRYWDQGGTVGGGSYTVGLLMLRTNDGRFIIEHVARGQWGAAERRKRMKEQAHIDATRYDNEVIIYIEQEGGSGGKEQMEQNILMLAGYPVYRDVVTGSKHRRVNGIDLPGRAKVTRAAPFAAMVENGGIYVVNGSWKNEFLSEVVAFPESKHADQVDAASGAFNKLAFRNLQSTYTPEKKKIDEMQSSAARLLEMQRKTQREKGSNPNPRTVNRSYAGQSRRADRRRRR